MRQDFIISISLFAGTCDLVTGLMLIFAPEATLALMHVPAVQDPVFLRFVGCFVSVVGLSYFVGLFSWWYDGKLTRLRTVWELTALFRLAAASFVAIQVTKHALSWRWLGVPLVDGFWCLLQAHLLYRGIFDKPANEDGSRA